MDVYIWLGLMVVFLIVEAACPIHLVSIWFAVGSLVAAITAALGGQIWLQLLLFIVVSGAILAFLWPFVRKVFNPKLERTNVDSVIGTQGYVTQEIDNLKATGQVKLSGMEWTARSVSGETISIGTVVKVEKIEGVKVFVSPVPQKMEVEC